MNPETDPREQYHHEMNESHKWQELLDFRSAQDQLMSLTKGVEEGHIDPLEAFIKVKVISDMANEIQKEIKEQAVREADKEPEKSFEKFGAKITKVSGKATYSYKHIQEWNELNDLKKNVEQGAVQALKAAQNGKSIFDPVTGEEIPTADVEYSPDTIQIKLL